MEPKYHDLNGDGKEDVVEAGSNYEVNGAYNEHDFWLNDGEVIDMSKPGDGKVRITDTHNLGGIPSYLGVIEKGNPVSVGVQGFGTIAGTFSSSTNILDITRDSDNSPWQAEWVSGVAALNEGGFVDIG